MRRNSTHGDNTHCGRAARVPNSIDGETFALPLQPPWLNRRNGVGDGHLPVEKNSAATARGLHIISAVPLSIRALSTTVRAVDWRQAMRSLQSPACTA